MPNLSLKKNCLSAWVALAIIAGLFMSCQKNSVNPAASNKFPGTATLDPLPAGLPPNTISTGLVAYWSFANTVYDFSGNGHNGTIVGGITNSADRNGHTVGAYHFDGSTAYISVPDNAALRLGNTDFTLNAWVNLDAYNSSFNSGIMSKRITGVNNGWFWGIRGLGSSPTGPIIYGPGGGSANAIGTAAVGLGNWHMVTSVYTLSTSTLSIYIDGSFDNSTPGISAANAATTAMLYIGADNPSIGAGYFLKGSLNDLRIYNRAITFTEIVALLGTADAPTAGLLAYWPLTNTSNDLSGNGNNGTPTAITTTTDRFGNSIGAYHFNGTTSVISVPDKVALRLGSTSFTLNAWVKLDAYNASFNSSIMSKRITGLNNGWFWGIRGLGSSPTGPIIYGPGGGSTNAIGTVAVGLSAWHMVTSIYNLSTSTLNIYIDGNLDNSTPSISAANAATTAALYIGADNPSIGTGYFLQGSLNDIRIYNRTISNIEIQQLYSALN